MKLTGERPMEGATPFQVMMDRTDKKLVGLEMDVFWVSVAGHGELVPRRGVGRIAGVAAGPDGLLLVAGREARANALEAWRGW